ncbi:MAG TPA: hypothetical protein VFX61_22595 [Micromonosporaceae bacterium]|nr:hypothetical protein [Micromonosporaceae bacterium]
MDEELFPEPVAHPRGRVVTGRVVRLMPGYGRAVRLSQPVMLMVVLAAGVAHALLLLLAAVRPRPAAGQRTRRRWRQLREGPEFLVTPLRIRDVNRVLYEVEIHGHLPQSALEPADHVQITLRRQGDPDLPARAERIVNLTTGQLLTPRIPTFWSHLGPALLLQALLGLLLAGSVAAFAVTVG